MESNNLTLNEINSLVEVLKNDKDVAKAIIIQQKDIALQAVREKLYTFLQERDLKSVYAVELKDNVLEAEKLSEYVYRKIKEASVKEKSENAVDSPNFASEENKEQHNPTAEQPQLTNEPTPAQDALEEKIQPQAGAIQHTQAVASNSPTSTISTSPTLKSHASNTALHSFVLTVPNRFVERKNAGELTEQNAKIEFINHFTNALRTEHINENTDCRFVRLNGSTSLTQAAPGKTILDVCCDLATAITFGQMQNINNILGNSTHKQSQATNMNPAMGPQGMAPAPQNQGMTPMMGEHGMNQINNGTEQVITPNPTAVNSTTMGPITTNPPTNTTDPTKTIDTPTNNTNPVSVPNSVNNESSHQTTPNFSAEIVNDPLDKFKHMKDSELIDLLEADMQHDTGLTSNEVDAIIEYLTNAQNPESNNNIKQLNERYIARIPMREMDND